ncbi:hypothetical protein BU23DRAFT_602003 [Bimuria novae-zelandiae CBS 107.79]|uniref:Uncharacterized protein n=1 Tax=Bimuria novae-zelandiae CBS 107.79 TaxID=1447943 RepID=A0A6A5UXL8_9PLEO|nr:hypothetical protein BU23DRAFT_602003 [Bimuria novae-zelandiae CBS 107.79]
MDRPNRYDANGYPNSFGGSRDPKPFPITPSARNSSQPTTPTATSVTSPRHGSFANTQAGPFKREPLISPLPRDTPAGIPSGPPTLPPPSLPIPIPQPPVTTPTAATYELSLPIGRPPFPSTTQRNRNRRGLSISTGAGLQNPFLHPAPLTEESRTGFGRGMEGVMETPGQTPSQSPTTPNSRLLFAMEYRGVDGRVVSEGAGVEGGKRKKE